MLDLLVFHEPTSTVLYTLSLHDALPICGAGYVGGVVRITPLEVLSYALPDTVEIPSLFPKGPVTWKNRPFDLDRKSTRLNSSHSQISYAVFCLKKKKH